VALRDNTTRDDLARSPGIVETRPEPEHTNKRSWEKDALIIGGSAGAGTAIGAVAGGKKGAGVGAVAGGVGGLIFDLVTRNKK
jgi:alkyl hydroperoxide reductase subunit AhpF